LRALWLTLCFLLVPFSLLSGHADSVIWLADKQRTPGRLSSGRITRGGSTKGGGTGTGDGRPPPEGGNTGGGNTGGGNTKKGNTEGGTARHRMHERFPGIDPDARAPSGIAIHRSTDTAGCVSGTHSSAPGGIDAHTPDGIRSRDTGGGRALGGANGGWGLPEDTAGGGTEGGHRPASGDDRDCPLEDSIPGLGDLEAIPAGVMPEGVIPAGVIPERVIPEGVIPEGGIPEGAIPEGVIPEGAIPEGGVPAGIIPEGGIPEGALTEAACGERLKIVHLATAEAQWALLSIWAGLGCSEAEKYRLLLAHAALLDEVIPEVRLCVRIYIYV